MTERLKFTFRELLEGLWVRTYERLPFIYKLEDDSLINLTRGFLAEYFGMAIWIFLACGSVPAVEATLGNLEINPDSLLVISLAFGFGIIIPIYMVGEVSGAHFNPIVSTAAWLMGKISLIRAVVYSMAQLLGSITAACLLKFFVTNAQDSVSALGATQIAPGIQWIKGLYIEALLSTILVFCVIGLAIHPFGRTVTYRGNWDKVGPQLNTALAVGMLITGLNIVGIPLTGASMNPARSLGPALIAWDWNDHAIYWIGPFIGCAIGTFFALFLIARPEGRVHNEEEMEEFDAKLLTKKQRDYTQF